MRSQSSHTGFFLHAQREEFGGSVGVPHELPQLTHTPRGPSGGLIGSKKVWPSAYHFLITVVVES